MKATDCGQLDDYLDGELAAGVMRAFEEHLEWCASCRRSVAESLALSGLLQRAFAVEQGDSSLPPEEDLIELAQSTCVSPRRSRQVRLRSLSESFRRAAAGVVAVAAMLLLWAAALFFAGKSDAPQPRAAGTVTDKSMHRSLEADALRQQRRAIVHVANELDSVAIPMPSTHENVTIVWIYPAYKPVP